MRSWQDNGWREQHPHGETLVWFPDPIGGHDCSIVTGGGALLVDAFPGVPRISMLIGEPPKRTWLRRRFGDDGEWGAARVEVWGQRDAGHDCVVYGVVERTSVAAGAVLAVVAAQLGGGFGAPSRAARGARSRRPRRREAVPRRARATRRARCGVRRRAGRLRRRRGRGWIVSPFFSISKNCSALRSRVSGFFAVAMRCSTEYRLRLSSDSKNLRAFALLRSRRSSSGGIAAVACDA